MFCTNCGAKLEPTERFCPFCGEKIANAETAEPVASPVPPQQEPPHTASQPTPTIHTTGQGDSGKKTGVIIGAVALVAVVILAAVLLLGRDDTEAGVPSISPVVSTSPLGLSSDPPSGSVSSSAAPVESPGASPAVTDEPPVTSAPVISSAPVSPSVDLSGLHIGVWLAEDDVYLDGEMGWQALHLTSVSGGSMTFWLESVQAAPSNRTASTFPMTVTLSGNQASFPVNDSWGNSGTGTITVKDGSIHVDVDITSPDPTSMWDVGMDAEFYPDHTASTALPPQPTPEPLPTPTPTPTYALDFTEQELTNAFRNAGRSLSVDYPSLALFENRGAFSFDFGENSAYFTYYYDGSYAELNVGEVSNPSKLTDVAEAAFRVLIGQPDNASFRGLPGQVLDGEPSESWTEFDGYTQGQYPNSYVESVVNVYTGTYTVEGYVCTLQMRHSYAKLTVGRGADRYNCLIKFEKG